MNNIMAIEGIGPEYARKLRKNGIKTVEKLLAEGSTKISRKKLSQKTQIDEGIVLKWVNYADLFRLRGVGEEYSQLLESSGVDSVIELARRNAENLQQTIMDVNEQKNLVRKIPGLDSVSNWINQAKNMDRAVHH